MSQLIAVQNDISSSNIVENISMIEIFIISKITPPRARVSQNPPHSQAPAWECLVLAC